MKTYDNTPTKTDNPVVQMANRIRCAMDDDNRVHPAFFEGIEELNDEIDIEIDEEWETL